MKILEISPAWPHPAAVGGGESFYYFFTKTLLEREGVEAAILTSNYSRGGYELIRKIESDLGIKAERAEFGWKTDNPRLGRIVLADAIDWAWKFGSPPNPAPIWGADPLFSTRLADFLVKEKFDFIHFHNLRTWFTSGSILHLDMMYKTLARKAARPEFILTDHNAAVFPFPKAPLAKIDRFALVSKASETAIRSWGGKTEGRSKIIYIGYRSEVYSNKKIKRDIDVLYFSRIVPQKGLDVLLEALKILKGKKLKIVICGTAPKVNAAYLEKIKSDISRLGLDVEFNNKYLPYEDVAKYMNRAKVFVLPSVKKDIYGREYGEKTCIYPELFPTVLVEAAACGCVPISTDVVGANEFVANIDGSLLAKPNDPQDLSKKIAWALSEKWRGRLSEKAIAVAADQYTWQKTMDRFFKIIGE